MFFSLMKMVVGFANTNEGNVLKRAQIEYSIRRNFGGFEETDDDRINLFSDLPEDIQIGDTLLYYKLTKYRTAIHKRRNYNFNTL